MARRTDDIDEILSELRGEERLLPGMAIAEAKLRRLQGEVGVAPDLEALAAFIAENDDAILSPSVLDLLRSLRKGIRRWQSGPAEGRALAETMRRHLRRLLLAYAMPRVPKAQALAKEEALLATARLHSLMDSYRTGAKRSQAFENRAAELGLTKPTPGKGTVAAARREQRARKRAGLPPRPPGRPRRSD